MGSCKLELPATGAAADLQTRFNNMLPNASSLSASLLGDAAEEFFRKTARWRYVANKIELSKGDQHIDLDMPEGVRVIRVHEPVYIQGVDCHEYTIHRKTEGTTGNFRNTDTARYNHHDHASNSGNRFYGGYGRRAADSLGFYEPHPGRIMFSDCLTEDYTFRTELILKPSGFAGIDNVPESILEEVRKGIVSMAIVAALEMPEKPWTEDTDSRFYIIHNERAKQAIKEAKLVHNDNIDPHRPHGDRLGALREMSSRGYNVRK